MKRRKKRRTVIKPVDKVYLQKTFRKCVTGQAKIYQAMLKERIDPLIYEKLHAQYTDKEMVDHIRATSRSRARRLSGRVSKN